MGLHRFLKGLSICNLVKLNVPCLIEMGLQEIVRSIPNWVFTDSLMVCRSCEIKCALSHRNGSL